TGPCRELAAPWWCFVPARLSLQRTKRCFVDWHMSPTASLVVCAEEAFLMELSLRRGQSAPHLMQRQCVSSPRHVLPSAEVPQELGAARLPHQGEVIETQLLEASPESPAILHFSRDE